MIKKEVPVGTSFFILMTHKWHQSEAGSMNSYAPSPYIPMAFMRTTSIPVILLIHDHNLVSTDRPTESLNGFKSKCSSGSYDSYF